MVRFQLRTRFQVRIYSYYGFCEHSRSMNTRQTCLNKFPKPKSLCLSPICVKSVLKQTNPVDMQAHLIWWVFLQSDIGPFCKSVVTDSVGRHNWDYSNGDVFCCFACSIVTIGTCKYLFIYVCSLVIVLISVPMRQQGLQLVVAGMMRKFVI